VAGFVRASSGRRSGWLGVVLSAAFVLASCASQPISPAPSIAGPLASSARPSAEPAVAESPSASLGTPPVPAARGLRIERSAIRLPAGRSRSVALLLGSEILVCGGLTAAGTTDSILRINLPAGAIEAHGTLPAPVHDAGGAVLNGVGFIFGGGRFGPGATVQRVGANGNAASSGRLPADRADLVAVAIPGSLALVGGGTTTFYDRRVLATSDGLHFTQIATLLVGVRYPAVTFDGGRIYVIGGSTASGDTTAIQAIDPATGRVQLIGRLPRARSHAAAFVVGGALLIAGGRVAGQAQDSVLRLDPATGTVRQVGRLPYPVSDLAVAVVGTTAYLMGGESAAPLASVVTVSMT